MIPFLKELLNRISMKKKLSYETYLFENKI